MKKSGLVFACFFIFVFLIFSRDSLVSWYLSSQTGLLVELHGLQAPRWGELSFSRFRINGSAQEPAWIEAEKGTFSLKRAGRYEARLTFENAVFGPALQKKMDIFSSWAGASVSKPDRFDRAVFLIRREGPAQRVRILSANAPDFKLAGAAVLQGRRLEKLGARLDFSSRLSSGWPEEVTHKMIAGSRGWRGLGLVFGGKTWTLRGGRGPLLQFSGRLSSNSH